MGCWLQLKSGSGGARKHKGPRAVPFSSPSLSKATLSHSLIEFVPILIPTGTESLHVLYKYFILFQQQLS